jgi:hypothetical protein
MQAEPWASYAVWEFDHAGERVTRPMTQKEWEKSLNGVRQQMQMHDAHPPEARRLVCEHNVTRGMELYREQLLAAPRCPHGRYAPSCAQCTYHQAVAASGRAGETLTRQSSSVLDRVRKRVSDA